MRKATKADLIFGLILGAVALAICAASWGMVTRFASSSNPFYYTPGFVPLIFGAVLLLLSVLLVVQKRAAFSGSWRVPVGVRDILTSRGVWAVLLIGVYVALLPRLHFVPATGLFLLLALPIFYKRTLLTPLLVAVTVTAAVYLIFSRVFIIPLP